jgi:hypothetical protein
LRIRLGRERFDLKFTSSWQNGTDCSLGITRTWGIPDEP